MNYTINYNRTTKDLMDRTNEVIFDMVGPDGKFQVSPGLYYIRNQNGETNAMAWPHIRRQPFHDIYFTVGAMELNASEVTTLKPGQTARFDRLDVKFVKMTREGEPGKAGTKFGALLEVGAGPHKFEINPQMELSSTGTHQVPAKVGNDYFMTLQGMDAATGSVNVQLHFMNALYPVELFYKPMTILVWIGTGILTIAGFWAAWVRRRVAVAEVEPEEGSARAKKADEGYAPAPAS
jgi:cytochrome c-type biogenesis protein CcmF